MPADESFQGSRERSIVEALCSKIGSALELECASLLLVCLSDHESHAASPDPPNYGPP